MTTLLSLLLDGAAVVVAGTLAGNEFAVAVVNAQLARLDERTEPRVASPLAGVFGRVMPAWYALALVLAFAVAATAHARGSLAWEPAAGAALLYAGAIAATLVALVPINNRIAAWDVQRPPAGWRDERRRWDARHRVRVAVLLAAASLLAAAAVAGGAR